jgi:light-regulated signal transduction histidine kinase (bacteriophytochrome)
LRAKVSVFIELYKQNHKLLAQEQKLIAINKSLEAEINERKISEEHVKALNLQLLQNIDKLEAANKDLDRFAFMASHDLQEPLRKIRTFGDRLNSKYKDLIDEDGKKYLERMQYAAQRMQLLIQDILTFSKISSREKEFVECDLNAVLNEVIIEFEPTVHEKKVTLKVGSLPVLHANPGLIRPLFFNLISNSLKYSRSDTAPFIHIHSDLDDGQSSTKYCRIFFEDNGIGFDQKYSEQVFRMFTRLHEDKRIEGTGIGLALCKKIVEEHDGFISVRSKINEGSTFIVSLPLHPQRTSASNHVFSLKN